MPWVITNNSFFIKSDKRGCATPVKDGKKAKVFTDLFYAEEFLRSLPKKLKNLGYYIAPLETQQVAAMPQDAPENWEHVAALPYGDQLEPEFYLNAISEFRKFVHTIQSSRAKLKDDQEQAEMEIEDLLHITEFYDLSPDWCQRVVLMLKDARIRRRQCKNAIAWTDFVLDADPNSFLRCDPSPRIKGTQLRQYRPRALPDLFRELCPTEYEICKSPDCQ